MKEIKCPNCITSEFLREILYGMPSDDFDVTKFYIGGCIASNATLHCTKCEWENDEGIIELPAIF